MILKFSLQGPRTHKSENYIVKYFYDAVNEAKWAHKLLTQCYTIIPSYNFQQLFTALDSARLQQQKIVKKTVTVPKFETSDS